ncbi:hypothetical protein C810_01528 [Lachnospiraceae bacterium A2]|nr:hypothetical protein C810_01528 [Lachnospiraceae bacterium A2]
MSREHLYKAKRVNWRELPKEEWWVEGFYVQLPKISLGATIVAGGDLCAEDVADYIIVNKSKQHSSFSNAYPLEVVECEQYEVDPETICEYTQMTGKNRVKIFEGDIIKTDFFNQVYGYEKPDKSDLNIYKVYFNGITYCVKNKERECTLLNRSKDCEIIGNIFDNPELLEGGKTE